MKAGIDSPKFISRGMGYASGYGNFASIPYPGSFTRKLKPNAFVKYNGFEWYLHHYGGQWKAGVQLPYET